MEEQKTETTNQEQEEQQTNDKISAANAAAARMELANKEHAKLLAKQERMKVEATLSGTADAGQPPKKEEDPEDYVKKVLANDI